jgi:DDE superfamily endonuclease
MVVIQGKVALEGYAQNDLDGEVILGFSDTGLATSPLIRAWLNRFNETSFQLSPSFKGFKLEEWFDLERSDMPGVSRRYPGRPPVYRMLLYDGYFSHLELPFVEFCEEYEIIPFCFPPHLTHLIQPLDVSVFSVFKHHHRVCIQDKVRTGDLDFSVFDFLSAFQTFHKETFTYHTLLNGWKATGLDPKHVNSSVIISRLGDFLEREKAQAQREREVREPVTPPPRLRNVESSINAISGIKEKYQGLMSSPSRQGLVDASVHLRKAVMIEKQLENHEAAAARRLNERKSRRQVKPMTGHIKVSQLRAIAEARDAEDKKKLLRRQQTMVNKLRNEHLKELKKDIAESKKAHRRARRALGQKVKFIILKLPPYKLQSFASGNWQEGIDIPGDEFEAQCDFIPLEDGSAQPGSIWQQLSSDGEEEFDFVIDPQPDPGLVDGATERQWDVQWPDAIGADAEELDPYERDSDGSMDEEPELPAMGYVIH